MSKPAAVDHRQVPSLRATSITYGDAQEVAAFSLNRLIVEDALPVADLDVELVLQCREAVIAAIDQRLYALGIARVPMVRTVDVTPGNLTVADFRIRQSSMLAAVSAGFPRLDPQRRQRPTHFLARSHKNSTVEHWRTASVALLSSSHALDAAEDKVWLHDPGAGWHLVRDLAVTMEAVVVLDSRLHEVGILNGLTRTPSGFSGEDARVITSQVARSAGWRATNVSPDRASPEVDARPQAVIGPVKLVRRPADVAPAQRQLAGFIRGLGESDPRGHGRTPFSASAARMIVASQLLVMTYGELMTSRSTAVNVHEVGASFSQRKQVLQDIQARMAPLIDSEAVADDKRVPWQQGEITAAIRRLERSRHPGTLSPEQLLDLASASAEVTRATARGLRRELTRHTGNLRLADPADQVGNTRVHRGHPLDIALKDLFHLPPPALPISRLEKPVHRTALRVTLDLTPTSSAIPVPFDLPVAPRRGGPSW